MNTVSRTKELKEPKFLDWMSILIVDFGQKGITMSDHIIYKAIGKKKS